ncbi:hypothetical protein RHGRI_014939 [Rhododendron griersonianum]|uniref:Uncharacterized protein n=1 Tax=Rhododendron griersonianum TaxID=479676 RepID=A0AAV6KBY6_9ERIC|nr:hypothetical protein RHGRI_014939 [Rhododendron griersonianum]
MEIILHTDICWASHEPRGFSDDIDALDLILRKMRKPVKVFALRPIIVTEIKMPQVGKVAELMRNWTRKAIPGH